MSLQQSQHLKSTPTTATAPAASTQANYPRVEHQHLTRMDVNSIETDLMKLLNDFSNSRLKKYG